jgi:hypothetical protein
VVQRITGKDVLELKWTEVFTRPLSLLYAPLGGLLGSENQSNHTNDFNLMHISNGSLARVSPSSPTP